MPYSKERTAKARAYYAGEYPADMNDIGAIPEQSLNDPSVPVQDLNDIGELPVQDLGEIGDIPEQSLNAPLTGPRPIPTDRQYMPAEDNSPNVPTHSKASASASGLPWLENGVARAQDAVAGALSSNPAIGAAFRPDRPPASDAKGDVPFKDGMRPQGSAASNTAPAPVATSPQGSSGAAGGNASSAPRDPNPYADAAAKDPTGQSALEGITNAHAADLWYQNHPGTGPHDKLGYRQGDIQKIRAQGENTARAVEAAGAREAAEHAKLVDFYGQEAARAKEASLKREASEAARAREVQAQMEKLNQATDEAKKAELSGESYLSRHPVAGIFGALSAIVGGVYAGYTGRENDGLKQLNAAIDRDIQIQKYNLDKKQSAVANQNSLLGQMRTQFGDTREAEHATEIAMRQLAADKMVGMAEGIKNVKMKNDVLLGAQEMRNQAFNKSAEFERAVYLSSHQSAGVPSGASRDGKKKGVTNDEMNDRFIPRFNAYTRDPIEARELRGRLSAGDSIVQGLNTAISSARKTGVVDRLADKVGYETQALERVNRVVDGLVQPLTTFNKGGAAGDKEAERARKTMMGAIRAGRPVEDAIIEFKNEFESRLTDLPKEYGLQKGTESYTSSDNGELTPEAHLSGQTERPRPAMPDSVRPRQ